MDNEMREWLGGFEKRLNTKFEFMEGWLRAADDLKPSAQAVHHAARSILQLPQPGRTTNAFMRDLLAPLVTGDTPEYQALRNDIFGEHTGLA